MPSPGKAFAAGDAYLFTTDDMIAAQWVPDSPSAALVDDYVWGGSIFPVTVTLDYTWLVQPVQFRPVPPVNSQTVTRAGAGSAYSTNGTSVAEYGLYDPGTVTLDTSQDGDPQSLATWTTTSQPNWLQRPVALTFDLPQRSTTEQWTILSVVEGTRITLANTPTSWPAECVSVFVDGIAHIVGIDVRQVAFTCSPLIGAAAGQVGPWFKLGTSLLNGTDVAPY